MRDNRKSKVAFNGLVMPDNTDQRYLMMEKDTNTTPWRPWIARIIVRLAVVLAFVVLVKFGNDLLFAKFALLESAASAQAMTGLIIMVMLGYALLLAVPFVPGVEIGVAVLMMEGAKAAPMVYGATVTGLFLAFCIGRYVPMTKLISLCKDLSLRRMAILLERIETTPREDRLDAMHDRLPRLLVPVLVRYRYVTLGFAINLPGNIALGGGGGIMIAGGLSRLFHTGFTLLTIALATLPVPLAVWVWGKEFLQ
ncbi:MAG: hypothetical protein ACJAZ1_003271 [Yoonia sp.]|jgi:hypothetical protein